jgi:alpha-glucosidase (family GH31 glycosyl hydrolase)
MTRNYSDMDGEGIRRIVGMILLFAFIGVRLWAQGELPLNDTVERSSRVETERTLQQGDPPGRLRPGSGMGMQPDTLRADSTREVPEWQRREGIDHSPKRAMFYSLALPGLGQAYNKKYFKIPIVYGALAGVGYWIYFNTQGYRQASLNYSNDPSNFNETYLRLWRRQLELSYITLVGTYALQVLDAYVDAYLFYWDVSPDLAIRVEPTVEPLYLPVGQAVGNYGISCKLTF